MLHSYHRELTETYKKLYLGEIDDITDVMIEEIVEELVEECVEFGYTLEEATDAIEEAAELYFDEATVTMGRGSELAAKARKERMDTGAAERRSAARKAAVKTAVSKVKSKAAGAAVSAYAVGKSAKEGAKRAAGAVSAAAKQKKAQVKSGVKKMLGAGLRAVAGGAGSVAQKARKVGSAASKAAERLGEESLNEISADLGLKASKAADRKRAQLAASGDKPAAAAKAAQASRLYTKQAKKRLNKEEVDIFDVVLEYLIDNGHAETIGEAAYIMSQMNEQAIQDIIETRMDPRGRPASGPMNVYRQSKPNTDPAFQAALKSHREKEAKKSPEQKKAELDAYIKRQRENK